MCLVLLFGIVCARGALTKVALKRPRGGGNLFPKKLSSSYFIYLLCLSDVNNPLKIKLLNLVLKKASFAPFFFSFFSFFFFLFFYSFFFFYSLLSSNGTHIITVEYSHQHFSLTFFLFPSDCCFFTKHQQTPFQPHSTHKKNLSSFFFFFFFFSFIFYSPDSPNTLPPPCFPPFHFSSYFFSMLPCLLTLPFHAPLSAALLSRVDGFLVDPGRVHFFCCPLLVKRDRKTSENIDKRWQATLLKPIKHTNMGFLIINMVVRRQVYP